MSALDKLKAAGDASDLVRKSAEQGAQSAKSGGPGALSGLFGGGDSEQGKAAANDFIKRVTEGNPAEGFGDDEAREVFKRVRETADPDTMRRATEQAINRLEPGQREEFAKMLQERMGGVDRSATATAGAAEGGPGMDDLLGGLLGGGGGGGLGGMLGGLLGGGSGQGGGLDDLLGGLLGGGASTGATQGGGSQGGSPDLMDMFGDFMGSAAGKAVIGGIAAFAMKEMMDKG